MGCRQKIALINISDAAIDYFGVMHVPAVALCLLMCVAEIRVARKDSEGSLPDEQVKSGHCHRIVFVKRCLATSHI